MLYAKLDGNTWIKNDAGYANQMNMDGAEPSGFYWSDWRSGTTYDHPNDPLLGWITNENADSEYQWFETDAETITTDDDYYCYSESTNYYYYCTEEEFMDLYYTEEDDSSWWGGEEEEFEDVEWYECWDSYTDTYYTCDRDAYLNTLEINCLRDIWLSSDHIGDFWRLFFENPWTMFVWF